MNRSVLVVDDDDALQESLQALLEMEGYDVTVAADGLEALRKLDSMTPAVILLDLMMPRMDGFEFVAELRRQGRRAGLPIVVLTADNRAKHKADQVGADGFLAKPFDATALLDELSRLAS